MKRTSPDYRLIDHNHQEAPAYRRPSLPKKGTPFLDYPGTRRGAEAVYYWCDRMHCLHGFRGMTIVIHNRGANRRVGAVNDIAAAQRMLDTFASVGAQSFVVTKTELEWPEHKKVKWGKAYPLEELRKKLPSLIRFAAIREPVELPDGKTAMAGENLIIRPTGPAVAFVQLDDLSAKQLDRVRPAVFIIHATSPGNYQAWIAVSGVPEGKEPFKEFMRRVRKAVGGTDKSASHATRLAGTENFKLKYAPDYPTVTIAETHPGRVVTPEKLAGLGLLAAPEPALDLQFRRRVRTQPDGLKEWPSYETVLAGAPRNREGTGPDRSVADFFWCKLALQRGFTVEDTEAKLAEVSERARQRIRGGDPGYVGTTVLNAADAARRGRQKSRG